jgi:hypothetical protein
VLIFFLSFFALLVLYFCSSRRPWHEILTGVDWMQNSTRILRLPFGTDPQSFSKIKLEINSRSQQQNKEQRSPTAPNPPLPTFIAQMVPETVQKSSSSSFPLHLEAGKHPLAKQIDVTMAVFFPPAFRNSPAVAAIVEKLIRIVIGQALPFRIQATRGQCPNIPTTATEQASEGQAPEHSVSLLIAVNDKTKASNSTFIGDSIRNANLGLSLWHPSVINRSIWFISDPRCSYTVR